MSKKDERFARVEEMLLQGALSDEDICAHVASEFGVKEDTVQRDIDALKAQSDPLPFGGDEELLTKLLSGEIDPMRGEVDMDDIVYEVPKGEEKFVHALIETVTYGNEQPPRKASKPFIQKYDPKAWNNYVKYHRATGWTVHKVLHMPENSGAVSLEEAPNFGTKRLV